MQLTQTRLRGRSREVVTLLHRIFCKPLLTHPKQLLPLLRHARFSIHPTPLLNLRHSQKVLCCNALKFLSMLLTTLTLCIKFFWTTNLSTAPAHPLRTIDIVTIPKCITHLSNLWICPTMTLKLKCPTMTWYPKPCVFLPWQTRISNGYLAPHLTCFLQFQEQTFSQSKEKTPI